jgi:hypothetical protein
MDSLSVHVRRGGGGRAPAAGDEAATKLRRAPGAGTLIQPHLPYRHRPPRHPSSPSEIRVFIRDFGSNPPLALPKRVESIDLVSEPGRRCAILSASPGVNCWVLHVAPALAGWATNLASVRDGREHRRLAPSVTLASRGYIM